MNKIIEAILLMPKDQREQLDEISVLKDIKKRFAPWRDETVEEVEEVIEGRKA